MESWGVMPLTPGRKAATMTVMDPNTYILQRQALWALRRGIALQGSAGDRGRRAYTPTPAQAPGGRTIRA